MMDAADGWPLEQPHLETERLVLRPLGLSDAPHIQLLAGDFAIADTTLNVPHPYLDGMAEAWVSTHLANFQQKKAATYGLIVKETGLLIGVIGLGFTLPFGRAELGYWIGRSFWNLGYATEAGHAVVSFAFAQLRLHKLEATHLQRNPTSGRVLRKLGFQQEGVQRDHVLKWNRFEDIAIYGLLSPSA